MRDNLIDLILLILGILSIILFYAVSYYLMLAVLFWSWDYNNWVGTVVDGGFMVRLLLILMYLVLK
jgi:hypothetical protein